MKIEKIKSSKNLFINGPFILIPDKFSDERGYFYESWNKEIFNRAIKRDISFVQDNHSKSFYGVLRGLHFQKKPYEQAKLIRVINGAILDIIVDLRFNSPTFKEWASITLNKQNRKQLWIPEGFAHGFISLTKQTEVNYKTNNFWNKKFERTLIWNDLDLKINWKLNKLKLKTPIVSKKDLEGKSLQELIITKDFF
ncbi:dTDP-4-dehydrorhamnose 3,5-epimerase [uncultured Prochlorococcus sp.]|uniref:dTDP-4-dehydrorhamnose 3,5-epimerase n=1 Tax=uncultured Prochlorococcus sp. TaxID=159733 RepID=UPI002588A85C|nr:dTDP-4-dehydrorhamnose 3,5-epimerase [uncultured Prochlorococcus sp.]